MPTSSAVSRSKPVVVFEGDDGVAGVFRWGYNDLSVLSIQRAPREARLVSHPDLVPQTNASLKPVFARSPPFLPISISSSRPNAQFSNRSRRHGPLRPLYFLLGSVGEAIGEVLVGVLILGMLLEPVPPPGQSANLQMTYGR
jgi:hypothetical protein